MKKQFRGYGLYLIIFICIALAFVFQERINNTSTNQYGVNQLIQDLDKDNIKSVTILPKEEYPLGTIIVKQQNDTEYQFNSVDVRDIDKIAREHAVEPVTKEVSKPSWFVTSVLPYLIMFAIMVFLIYTLFANQAASGGGGSSKVMNFGKSRAKMTTDENKKTTFKKCCRFR